MFNLNNDLSIWLEGIIDYLSTIADAALFGQALTKINLKMDMKCIKGLKIWYIEKKKYKINHEQNLK